MRTVPSMATVHSAARTRSPPGSGLFNASVSPQPQSISNSFHSRFNTSPSLERRSLDNKVPSQPSGGLGDGPPHSLPSILLRRLPQQMSLDALNSMLIFAEDFLDTNFIDSSDDHGFQSAVARFRTHEAASEACNRLHGKTNPTGDAQLLVEMVQSQSGGLGQGLGVGKADGAFPGLARHVSNPTSVRRTGSSARQSSRYFQSMGEKLAPIKIPPSTSENDVPDYDSFYSQQSPRGPTFGDGQRITGKSMISEDANDETEDLLRDPLGYAKNDRSNSIKRSSSNAQPPVSRLAGLTLNTTNTNSNGSSMISPIGVTLGGSRQAQPFGSPNSELSPTGPVSPTGGSFPLSPQQFHRHHYPPANPADQNPPCNTLYVGNLPLDTSEDELKAMFSKQRGYKRLCFRTKHNGPMCFVEFEDVSFATKALNELYGHPLHNSVKGGIRLSFSKNPLGVRTGQANSMNPTSPLQSPNGAGGIGCPPGFSTASGPPPGLSAPPGLASPPAGLGSSSSNGFGSFYGPGSPQLSHNASQPSSRTQPSGHTSNPNSSSLGNGFLDGPLARNDYPGFGG